MQRLGQHFLKNKSAVKKIVAALDLQNGDTVIEVGPGHGELTLELARKFQILNSKSEILNKKGGGIIAIEKDGVLAGQLKEKFRAPNSKFQIQILEGDALKILPKLITELPNYPITNYKVVGNIPYYITGHLFRILSEAKTKPLISVFTIQKEVAERICEKPPRMNRLAAIIWFWAEPKIITNLSPSDFSPPPKVSSAIIKLELMIKNKELSGNAENYYKTVKILFAQPRKTILNNLGAGIKNKELRIKICDDLKKINIKPNDRPQNLGVNEIIKITDLLDH